MGNLNCQYAVRRRNENGATLRPGPGLLVRRGAGSPPDPPAAGVGPGRRRTRGNSAAAAAAARRRRRRRGPVQLPECLLHWLEPPLPGPLPSLADETFDGSAIPDSESATRSQSESATRSQSESATRSQKRDRHGVTSSACPA
jgi:hypothetical protein